MANYYIKAMKRAKWERFAGYFFRGACVFGLLACVFVAGYTMGNNRGKIDGFINGALESQACESRGGNGYFIDADGLTCLYE